MVDFLSDLILFLKTNKKYWMVPVIVMLVLIGALLMMAQSAVVAPFVYTLF